MVKTWESAPPGLVLCSDQERGRDLTHIRRSQWKRMGARRQGRWALLFTPGSAQVTRVCQLLQRWMTMVFFAWNAQRLTWLTTPSPPPPVPLPTPPPCSYSFRSCLIFVVVLTPFNVLLCCLSAGECVPAPAACMPFQLYSASLSFPAWPQTVFLKTVSHFWAYMKQ